MNTMRALLHLSIVLVALLFAPFSYAFSPDSRDTVPVLQVSVPAAASIVLSHKTAPEQPETGSGNGQPYDQTSLIASSGLGFLSAGIAGSLSLPGASAFSFSVVPSASVAMAGKYSVQSFSSVGIHECIAGFTAPASQSSGASLPYSILVGRTSMIPAGFEFLYPVDPSVFFGGVSGSAENLVSVSVEQGVLSFSVLVMPFAPDFCSFDPAGSLFDRKDIFDEYTTTGLLGTTYKLDSIRYSDETGQSSTAFAIDPSAALRAGFEGNGFSLSAAAFAGLDRTPAWLWRLLFSVANDREYYLEVKPVSNRIFAVSTTAQSFAEFYTLSFSASAIAGRLYASGDIYDPLLRGDWLPAEERATVISTARLALDPFASGLLLLTGEWSHSLCLDDPGNIRRPFMDRRICANAAVNLPRYAGVGAQVSCDYALSLLDGSFLVSPAVTLSSVSGASAVFRYTAAYGESDTELGQFAREGTVWCSVFLRCP